MGHLWVGTQNGCIAMMGAKFLRYGAEQGIPDRIIDKLFVGLDGTLWVGAANGVYFERKDDVSPRLSFPSPNVFTHPTGTKHLHRSNQTRW